MQHDVLPVTQSRRNVLIRFFVILAFVAGLGLIHLGDLTRLGDPNGSYGMITDGSLVKIVKPGSPAFRAGLRAGDRIDLSENSWLVRKALTFGPDIAIHGYSKVFVVIVKPVRRTILLHAEPEPASDNPLIVLREVFLFGPVLIGAVLLLMRPSSITWWLFFIMLAAHAAPTSIAYLRIFTTPLQHHLIDIFRGLVAAASALAEVMFAFSFAGQRIHGWRIVPVAGALLAASYYFVVSVVRPEVISLATPTVDAAVSIALGLCVVAGLTDGFLHAPESNRSKMLWLGAGLIIMTTFSTIDGLVWPNYATYALHTVLSAATLLFPILCAYALLATRAVDIRFAMSRTVVYGVLTATVIALFAIIDLFISRGIDEGRLSLPIDIVVAIALGFFFHGIQKNLDVAVDRLLFRRRYAADAALARAAKAVLHVHHEAAVAEYVVDGPARLLDLTGAAIYSRMKTGFALDRAVGWETVPQLYSEDDPLCVYLAAELAPVRPNELPLHREWPHHAVMAIPIVVRRQLQGFVLYGFHRNGADIDPEEAGALMPLVENAAGAYDHIAAAAMEQELNNLRSLVRRPSIPRIEP